jgi:HAD superfamily hydrolase (TIGR01509 family)
MEWVNNYQLFLFDFDGLLVNTEYLHYFAYINVCLKRGVKLDLSFLKYCQAAHAKSEGLKDLLENEYPKLFENEAKWSDIYEDKKLEYVSLLKTSKVELMEGVEELLKKLHERKILSCVVTNSTKQQIDLIIQNQPILKYINHFVTRECYTEPKPNPESYNKAIQLYGKNLKKIIGFEDSFKGIKALMGSSARPVLISKIHIPQIKAIYGAGDVFHFESFKEIPDSF